MLLFGLQKWLQEKEMQRRTCNEKFNNKKFKDSNWKWRIPMN